MANRGNHSGGAHAAPPEKSRTGLRIGIIVALVVVCCAAIAIFVSSSLQPSTPDASTDVSPAATEENSAAKAEEDALRAEEEAAAAAAAARTAAFASLTTELSDLLQPYGESVSLSYRSLDGALAYSIQGDESFVSASMIKLLILAEYIRQADAGIINTASIYTLSYNDIVAGTGVIQLDPTGTEYTYDDLAFYMISESDNTATNVLIDILGMDNINAEAARLGLSQTQLNRKMMDLYSGVENYISADDAAFILLGIANHTLGSAQMCARAEEYLLAQTDDLGLVQGLPDDVPFGHKTGSLTTVRHDGGIVYSTDSYVIVVLTSLGATTANALMAQTSATITDIMGA